MRKLAIYIFLIAGIISCKPDLNYDISGYTQKIIVEGFISNGEFPKVYLSLNIPLSEQVDSITILKNVIRTAKVTISDGTNSEILTSNWDKSHFPPYVYKGTEIKGEEGKTYYLTVEYGGYTIHSQTTIPHAERIMNFGFAPAENDTLRILSMQIDIDPSAKNGYRVYTLKKKDGYFIESPFVYNADFDLSGLNRFNISPEPTKKDPSYDEHGYFRKGDTVLVKICTLDSISTLFFNDLTIFSSTTGVGNNYFIGEKDTLKSNISSPGFGIWYGNGINIYQVVIE